MPVFTAKCDSASDKSEDFNKITRNKEAAETCREPRENKIAPHDEEVEPCDDVIEAIKQAEKDIENGDVYGPFDSVEELMKALNE